MQIDINDRLDKEIFSGSYGKIYPCDFALVLGCVPAQALKRAEMALHYYKNGGAKKLIVTGGVKHNHFGKMRSECDIMYDYLIRHGVPEEDVIRENSAEDTVQNVTCSLVIMCKTTSVTDVRTVTVITEPYHIRRSILIAEMFLPDYFEIHGYTEGVEEQYNFYRTDGDFYKVVSNEIKLIKGLLSTGFYDERYRIFTQNGN